MRDYRNKAGRSWLNVRNDPKGHSERIHIGALPKDQRGFLEWHQGFLRAKLQPERPAALKREITAEQVGLNPHGPAPTSTPLMGPNWGNLILMPENIVRLTSEGRDYIFHPWTLSGRLRQAKAQFPAGGLSIGSVRRS